MTNPQKEAPVGNVISQSMQNKFRELGLRYTMKAFRYCVDTGSDLNDLREYTAKNLLDLVMLGTPTINPEEAYTAIDSWLEAGHDMPMLHFFALESAKASGFFMREKSVTALTSMVEHDQQLLMPALSAFKTDLEGIANLSESLTNLRNQ